MNACYWVAQESAWLALLTAMTDTLWGRTVKR